jgi:hypothetical protein
MGREIKKQFKVALDAAMREKVVVLAEANSHSVATEIRLMIHGALAQQRFDWETRRLARDISHLAEDVARVSNGVAWHQHPLTKAALIEAITVALQNFQPHSEGKGTLPPDYEPRTIGRTVGQLYAAQQEDFARQFPGLVRRTRTDFQGLVRRTGTQQEDTGTKRRRGKPKAK